MRLPRLRLALIASNVGPLAAGYRLLYRLTALAAVALLRLRFPARFESVFLRGSLVSSPFVPAVSDIDLFFILRDTVSPKDHERAQMCYRRLAARLPVLDPYPWMLRWADVQKLYRENPSLRFRVLEGRSAWEHVWGRNRLADLPPASAQDVAVSHLFDLKSRLTYFSQFFLTRADTDALERRQGEYQLFKLVVDLVRITLLLSSGVSIFAREELIRHLRSGGVGPERWLHLGDDRLLSDFVAYSCAWKLRRSFFDTGRCTAADMESRLLRLCLDMLVAFYARSELVSAADLAAEHEHFYRDGRFLPSGHVVERVREDALASYAQLKARVLAGNAAGVDTVLDYNGLLVNLSNTDPRLGNCTVVRQPAPRD